jgi:hypothetical protein
MIHLAAAITIIATNPAHINNPTGSVKHAITAGTNIVKNISVIIIQPIKFKVYLEY